MWWAAAGAMASGIAARHAADAQASAAMAAYQAQRDLMAPWRDVAEQAAPYLRLTCSGCGAPGSGLCSYCGLRNSPRLGAQDIAGLRNVYGYATLRPELLLSIGNVVAVSEATGGPSLSDALVAPEAKTPLVFRLSAPQWMTRRQRRTAALAIVAAFGLLVAVAEMTMRGM